MRQHRHLILNWFRAKRTISSGVVEGLNGVVKLTTRKAFGFRTAKGIEIALFHGLGPASRARINPQILLRRLICQRLLASCSGLHALTPLG